ncbi:MAG: FtsX-like permease family protein [Sumerlaeia bacterium]
MTVFRLALRSLTYHWPRSMILMVAIALMVAMPVALNGLLIEFESQWLARARATPLVIGPKGSELDLVLHTLYFKGQAAEEISLAEAHRVRDSGYALAIPLHVRYTAGDFPVVGTSPDYFGFRGLELAAGAPLLVIGDCVLGAVAAQTLGLEPGDTLVTDTANLFDLAGAKPLQLNVRGVLAPARTADDEAVFVDTKTAWIIDGIGHGHEDVARNEALVLDRDATGNVTANAAVVPYTVITDENRGTFHFHAEPEALPITALIAVPKSEKAEALLRGRYLGKGQSAQIVVPLRVVEETMALILRAKRLFDANVAFVTLSGLLFLVLIGLLSLRLRAAERRTMVALGASRWTLARLYGYEYAMILACGLLTGWGFAMALRNLIPGAVALLAGGAA